jgi:hypothetical protein
LLNIAQELAATTSTTHELMKYAPFEKYIAGKWTRDKDKCNKNPQKRCEYCTKYHKVKTYCSCTPLKGLCTIGSGEHLKNVYSSR